MTAPKSSFLDKVLGRIDRLNAEGLQAVVHRLARERSFLEVLFNVIEDGVLVVDKAGGILYFNQAVTQLLGLPSETAQGQLITRFLPGLDWAQLSRPESTGSSRVVRHEMEVKYPRHRFLQLYAAPLDSAGSGASVALILHDATEARQQTFAAIESERVQALTLLAASVAHEIGNPLNALNIHIQLIERELKRLKATATPAEPGRILRRTSAQGQLARSLAEVFGGAQKMERFLGVAKGEIGRLDNIVTQFLQAIRPTPLRLQLVSLNEVVGASLELLRPELENRGLTIRELLAPQLPLAPLDPAQIQQVLVNLIRNAMQAMTIGGVLTLQTAVGQGEVWVSVADTGGGIPQETIRRIFEPFYTTKKKGTGLGLMIVQRIVREHRGYIEVDSRVGQGTTFRIRLPLHELQPRLLEARVRESAGDPADAASPAAGAGVGSHAN